MRQKKARALRKAARANVVARYKAAGKPIPKGAIAAEYNKDKKEYLAAKRKTGEPKLDQSRRQARNELRPESKNRLI